jgi:hypothetical protein
MLLKTLKREWRKRRNGIYIPDLGERHMVCNYLADEDGEQPGPQPMVDFVQYGKLLEILPDKIVNSLEKARLERAGYGPMMTAGLGYVELLGSIIVDATQVTGTSEARMVPAVLLPSNYLAPGGIPGRTLRGQLRFRGSTTAAANTWTFRMRGEATDVITGTAWAASGAIPGDATTAATNAMGEIEGGFTVRAVGSAGSVFAMGDADLGWMRFASAAGGDKALTFMGSAGSAAPAAVTKDTTLATYLNWTLQLSVAAHTCTTHRYMLESLN